MRTRHWWRVGGMGLFAMWLAASAAMGEDTARAARLEQLRKARHEAAHRQRRIIFNNDGDDAVYECKSATAQALLDCRTSALAGSLVDSIFYCTWCSGFGIFTHNTRLGEVFTTKAAGFKESPEGFRENKTADFIKQETDPLRIMVEFCCKHRIEILWSMRMNDTHDAWNDWYSPYLFPKLKAEHPEYLVSTRKKGTKHGAWSAVDYGRPEIRELAYRFVEEVCRNYDVDGVELDFFRHPLFFKCHAEGRDAGPAERAMMTGLLRRIRAMSEDVGLRRNKPLLIAVRVPDSVDCCKAIGLDIAAWLDEGLVDILAVSDYYRLNPWKVSVELGHKHGVPVYPSLSESRVRDAEGVQLRNSLESYRARAKEAWAAGADGIYMFNVFDPKAALWRELGDPAALARLDRVHCASVRGSDALAMWVPRGERFLNVPSLTPDRPIALAPGKPVRVEFSGPGAAAADVAARLHLRFQRAPRPADVAVTLSGKPLPLPTVSGAWLVFPVERSSLATDLNRVEVCLRPDCRESPMLEDLVLWVRTR